MDPYGRSTEIMKNTSLKNMIIVAGALFGTCVLIYLAVFIIKFLSTYYSTYCFLNWARRQRLVLVSGGPSSGKRLLLSYLPGKLANGKKTTSSFLGFFNNNKSYNVYEKKWVYNYCGFNQSGNDNRASSLVLINELEDRPFAFVKEEAIYAQGALLNLYIANHAKQKVWIAFLARGGYLWKMLSSRTNVHVICGGVETKKLLFWTYNRLQVYVDLGINKKENYFIWITKKELNNYKISWLDSFRNENQRLLESA